MEYDWDWTTTGPQRKQLTGIQYPTMPIEFKYTYDAGTWYEKTGRMTGVKLSGTPGTPIIHYATTGGGRNITQTWGDDKVSLDYNLDENTDASLFDRFGRIKTMDLRKITNPTTSTTIHEYEYGHDANGNRLYAKVRVAGDDPLDPGYQNSRSYIYEYDRLNRLVGAGRGKIDSSSAPPSFDQGVTPIVSDWKLDILGNWSENTAFVTTRFPGFRVPQRGMAYCPLLRANNEARIAVFATMRARIVCCRRQLRQLPRAAHLYNIPRTTSFLGRVRPAIGRSAPEPPSHPSRASSHAGPMSAP